MLIPNAIPGYRLLLILFGLSGAVWIALEGNLARVVGLGFFAALLVLLTVVQRRWGGQTLAVRRWWGLCLAGGLWLAVGTVLFTYLLMTLKSGLHNHGWEYTLAETVWVGRQLPLWSIAGLLLGLAVGLITAGMRGEPAGNEAD